MDNDKEEYISLLDILLIIVKNKKNIILITMISAVVMMAVLLVSAIVPQDSVFCLFPETYKPEGTVLLKVPGDNSGGFSSALGGSSGDLGSLVGLLGGGSLGSSGDFSELVKVLLKSNKLRDSIVKEFDFVEKYKVVDTKKKTLRDLFDNRIGVTSDMAAGTIYISYIDIDPEFGTNVVNKVVEELERIVKQLSRDKISRKKKFISDSLKKQEIEFKKAQENLIDYQKKYGIINISKQADASVSFISTLQSQIYTKELELKTLQEIFSDSDSSVILKKKEIDKIKGLLDEMKSGFKDYPDEFIPQNIIPDISAELLNLQQELTIQGLILKMLKEQFEAVKIEENDDSITFNILEKAEIPEDRFAPNRTFILIIVTFTAFIASIFIVFVKEYFLKVKDNPSENEKLSLIKDNLRFFKKK